MATRNFGIIDNELTGDCQVKNANTVLHAIAALRSIDIAIDNAAVANGFANVCEQTGLMGRWMKISDNPLVVCDTAHNTGGIRYIARQLSRAKCSDLRIVVGFVSDKDIEHILDMLPQKSRLLFHTTIRAPSFAQRATLRQSNGKKGCAAPCLQPCPTLSALH